MKRLWSIPLSLLLALPTWAQRAYHGDGPDDVLRFVPVATVYALKTCGVESKSGWKQLAVNTVVSYAFSAGTTWALKHSIHERRPDWTDNHSFPSGHTALAFTGAVILDKEYRHVSLDQRGRLCRGNGSGCRPHGTQPPCLAGCHSRSRHRCGQYALGLLARRENHGRAQPLRSDHRRTKPQPLHTTLQQIILLPSHTLTVFNFCTDKLNHLTTR